MARQVAMGRWHVNGKDEGPDRRAFIETLRTAPYDAFVELAEAVETIPDESEAIALLKHSARNYLTVAQGEDPR